MYYAQFFTRIDGEIEEMEGTDGKYHFDGRLSKSKRDHRINSRITSLNVNDVRIDNIANGIIGYKIMKGSSYDDAKEISNFINKW